MTRARWRGVLLALVALLYVASVPWYRETDAPLRLVLGLPDWVAVALLCYVAVAVLNAAAWLLTDVSDGEGIGPGEADSQSDGEPGS